MGWGQRLSRRKLQIQSEHCVQHRVMLSPDPQANVLPDEGQRDIFCLIRTSLLLKLMGQTDPPALLRNSISLFLGDVPAHEVGRGFFTPFCRHCWTRFQHHGQLKIVNGTWAGWVYLRLKSVNTLCQQCQVWTCTHTNTNTHSDTDILQGQTSWPDFKYLWTVSLL